MKAIFIKKIIFKKYFLLVCVLAIILLTQGFQPEAESEGIVHIAVFKEQGFPAVGLPKGLTPEWIKNNLEIEGYHLSYFNASQLSDKLLLNPKKIDFLILSYGEAFPVEAFDSIRNYLEGGGGLFTVAGKPFYLPMKKIENQWEIVKVKAYENFLTKLGIKYYQSEVMPSFCEFNEELFKEFSGKQLFTKADTGLTVTTSNKIVRRNPTHGNVFPYRIPYRDFLPFVKSLNKFGEVLNYPAILVKSWSNPYRKEGKVPNKWCLIAIKGENHPLNPKRTSAKKVLKNLMEYLSNKIVVHNLETNYACYRQGEVVKFEAKVLNYASEDRAVGVNFNIKDGKNNIVYTVEKKIILLGDAEAIIKDIWRPKIFFDDFYTIEVKISDKGRFIDKEKTGFVVWDTGIIKKEEPLKIEGSNFFLGDKKIFLKGINYYESKSGELAWLRPNMLNIKEDFKKMQKMNINFMRIHYHHSKWFRDYIVGIAKLSLGPYYNIADTSVLPTERSLRILDAFIQLAQKYDLIFCMDLFSLVPEEMGDPRGWLGLIERIAEPQKISLQKDFIKIIAKRYKDVPGITWDLWNEPRLEKKEDIELLRDWAKQLIETFRENGDNHPITIGDNLSLGLMDVLDYASIHTYNPENFNFSISLSKPFIFQELWNDVGCDLEEEMQQAEKLKNDFYFALEKGASGFAPWQWTRQARLWNDTNEPERWDDELGICVHDDGTLKPAGRIYSLLMNKTKK